MSSIISASAAVATSAIHTTNYRDSFKMQRLLQLLARLHFTIDLSPAAFG
jgi:peptidase E